MDITIRKANLEDIGPYTNLLQQTYQAAYTDESIGLGADCFSKKTFDTEDSQRYFKSRLTDTDTQKTWLAFDGDKLVGAITGILNNDAEAELTGFYVEPKHQGKGIGQKLYELFLNFAGDRDLLLDTYVHNVKTIKIYEKWGWKLDATRGEGGYFYRRWPEWPEGLQAKCLYMRLKKR